MWGRSIAISLFAVAAGWAQQYTISSIAGGSPQATPANARSYYIGAPLGAAADRLGNLFFATTLSCVFKLDPNGTLTLLAGTGQASYSGDGGPAAAAGLNSPTAVAVDPTGNIYVVDSGNNRIRKISAGGTITTIAGTGGGGYSGDGGPASAAQLNYPEDAIFDSAGNLFIADTFNHRIRKITSDGTITTVAGNGNPGFAGDGGPATQAYLKYPTSAVADSAGILYIADYNNARVRKVAVDGTITTVTGNGQQTFLGSCSGAACLNTLGDEAQAKFAIVDATCVRLDSSGNLLIADQFNSRVRKVTSDGVIHTIAGKVSGITFGGDGGLAVEAVMRLPRSIATDAAGNFYISDLGNYRVRKVSTAGIINTIAGEGFVSFGGDGGPAKQALLGTSYGLSTDTGGNIYIADAGNNRIRKLSLDGKINTVAGGDPAVAVPLASPSGVLAAADGSLFIADTGHSQVIRLSPDGTVRTVAGTGSSGYNGDRIPAVSAQISAPYGLALDRAGNLYIADYQAQRVRKVSTDGTISTFAGNGVAGFGADGIAATDSQIYNPVGLAVDGEGNLYVGEFAGTVRKVTPDGMITSVINPHYTSIDLGDGGPAQTANTRFLSGWLALDADENLYLTEGISIDSDSNRIRKIFRNGIITTIAGDGVPNYIGDGGPATSAEISTPLGITVDAKGSVYFSMQSPNVIRKLTPSGASLSIVTPAQLPAAGAGAQYSQTLAAAGGNPPYIWSIAPGALPGGMTLSTSGVLSGKPLAAGSFTFTVKVTDLASASATQAFSLAVNGALAIGSSATLTPGNIGAPYSLTLTSSGGSAPYLWSLSGTLPAGLSLSASGTISGTPTSAGVFKFTVKVSDSSNSSASMDFTITIGTTPVITAVVNGASALVGPIAPGEIVVIYGANLGPTELVSLSTDANGFVSTQDAGTTVFFNGTPAPIIYTSATVAAVIVPYEISGSQVQVTVRYQDQTSAAFKVDAAPVSPAIFTANSSGVGQAAAAQLDGSPNNASHPTPIGSTLVLFVTGEGQTSPGGVDGKPAVVPLPSPLLQVTVFIGGQQAFVQYAGGAPGEVAGVMQIDVLVPAGVQPGNVPITVQVGPVSSPPGVVVSVR